jgi:hypothetical protein
VTVSTTRNSARQSFILYQLDFNAVTHGALLPAAEEPCCNRTVRTVVHSVSLPLQWTSLKAVGQWRATQSRICLRGAAAN